MVIGVVDEILLEGMFPSIDSWPLILDCSLIESVNVSFSNGITDDELEVLFLGTDNGGAGSTDDINDGLEEPPGTWNLKTN